MRVDEERVESVEESVRDRAWSSEWRSKLAARKGIRIAWIR